MFVKRQLKVQESIRKDAHKLLNSFSHTQPVYGVSLSAFDRIIPSYFYPKYKIVSYKYGNDLKSLRRQSVITCFQKDFPKKDLVKKNSFRLIEHESVKKKLNLPHEAGLFLFKYKAPIENLVNQNMYSALHNSIELQNFLETKGNFMDTMVKLGMPILPAEKISMDQLDTKKYKELTARYGQRLVFQIADIVSAGGVFTFFIDSENDFHKFIEMRETSIKLSTSKVLKVAKFVEGTSICVTASVSKNGVAFGTIRSQAIGLSEFTGNSNNSGLYCGNDWKYGDLSEKTRLQIWKIMTQFGEYLLQEDYKGIFALDFIVEGSTGTAYPLECNPRYQGSSTIEGLALVEKGLLPLDVFHFGEFLSSTNMTASLIKKHNKLVRESEFNLSQLLMRNNVGERSKVTKNVQAGVYRYQYGELVYSRPGIDFSDLLSPDEVLLTNSVARPGKSLGSRGKMGTLVFGRQVLSKTNELNDFGRAVVSAFYDKFELVEETVSPFQTTSESLAPAVFAG